MTERLTQLDIENYKQLIDEYENNEMSVGQCSNPLGISSLRRLIDDVESLTTEVKRLRSDKEKLMDTVGTTEEMVALEGALGDKQKEIDDLKDKVKVTKEEGTFITDMIDEVAYSRTKFADPAGITVALAEETGEVAKAMLSESDQRVYAECIQVAATALRIALEGDPTLTELRKEFVKPPPHENKEEFFKKKAERNGIHE